jgi:hypothetical protein
MLASSQLKKNFPKDLADLQTARCLDQNLAEEEILVALQQGSPIIAFSNHIDEELMAESTSTNTSKNDSPKTRTSSIEKNQT